MVQYLQLRLLSSLLSQSASVFSTNKMCGIGLGPKDLSLIMDIG